MAYLTKEDIGKYLASEGLQPQERDFGYYFRYQMRNFFIEYDQEDEQYLRVIMPGIYEVDENNLVDVLTAANVVDRDRKVVKCFVLDEDVHVATELLIDATPNLEDIVPRALGMLIGAQECFNKALKG
jgi:hypothetical protein